MPAGTIVNKLEIERPSRASGIRSKKVAASREPVAKLNIIKVIDSSVFGLRERRVILTKETKLTMTVAKTIVKIIY